MFASFQSFLDKPVDLDYVFNPPSKLESFDAEEGAASGCGRGASSSGSQHALAISAGAMQAQDQSSRN